MELLQSELVTISGTRLSECWRRCVESASDARPWEDLLRNHMAVFSGIAYRVACRWGNPVQADVEEAVQEICLKLSTVARSKANPASTASDDAAQEAYLKSVAANTASDFFRSKSAKRRTANRGTAVSIDAPMVQLRSELGESRIETQVLWRQIEDGLNQVPDRERSIFLLYYRRGFTAKEIAAIPGVGLSLKGVESQILRTVKFIRKRLRGEESSTQGAF